MENRLIFREKGLIVRDSSILGICGENEQEMLIFCFDDVFVDGVCFLELEFPNGDTGFIELEKDLENKMYILQVKNSLLKYEGILKMQLKIVQDTAVWKSLEFEMYVLNAINATECVEDDYPDFVESTTAKLVELEEKIGSIPSIDGLASVEYVDNLVGNIELLLSDIADESEVI